MKEADIVRSMLSTLNALPGVFCLRTHGGAFQLKGTPDIIGTARGRSFVIETKRHAGLRPSPAQRYVLEKFRRAGSQCFVSCDPKVHEVVEWIESLPR